MTAPRSRYLAALMAGSCRRAAAVATVVAAGVLAGACGDEPVPETAPPRVDPALAPESVGEDLALHLNDDDGTVAAFANAGEHSLVADGRLWEIRRADRLIGALQITTVLPKVDLTDPATRESLVRQIIPGSLTRIRIGEVEVYTTVVNDKVVFVWFGEEVYEVLQLKDSTLADEDHEAIVADVIAHQATVAAWKPLPLEVVELSGAP